MPTALSVRKTALSWRVSVRTAWYINPRVHALIRVELGTRRTQFRRNNAAARLESSEERQHAAHRDALGTESPADPPTVFMTKSNIACRKCMLRRGSAIPWRDRGYTIISNGFPARWSS